MNKITDTNLINTSSDVTVIMATYNPVWEKCVFTIDSIIGQKDTSIELIVVDDGSSENLFDRFTSYLDDKGFENYKLIDHTNNQGTVKNYYDGLLAASGKYIKLISPGDALYNEQTLSKWLDYLKKSGKQWSFGDAVFYSNDKGVKQVVTAPAYPRMIDCYLSGNNELCRWNYVVLEDFALGAALLCERSLLIEYLKKFIGVVKYTEDLVHVAMMYEGILPAYFNCNVIFYEYGTGISTGEDKWKAKVRLDMKNAELAVAGSSGKDAFQSKLAKAIMHINSGSETGKKIKKYLHRGGMKKLVKQRLNPRLSSDDCSSCGNWWKSSI